MPKIIIAIIIIIAVIGIGCWIYQPTSTLEDAVIEENESSNVCAINEECVVFGETGDCNCGCYHKDHLPSGAGGECFCLAPTSCECKNSKCQGVFEDKHIIKTENGQIFSIDLETNPTTGYEWQMDFDPAYIEFVKKTYIPSSPELIGSGGKETFEFLAKKAGTTEITFSYLRPWEEKEPINTEIYEMIIE